MIIENMETIYQVGKGYATQALDALESLAEDESQAQEAESIKAVDQSISDRKRLEAPLDENSMFISEPAAESEDLKTPLDQDEEPVDTVLPKPQRMAFR